MGKHSSKGDESQDVCRRKKISKKNALGREMRVIHSRAMIEEVK
jgi:hypothetical protein